MKNGSFFMSSYNLTVIAKPFFENHEFVYNSIGGGDGSRTRVRKPIHINFSGCIVSFRIPPPKRRHAGSLVR